MGLAGSLFLRIPMLTFSLSRGDGSSPDSIFVEEAVLALDSTVEQPYTCTDEISKARERVLYAAVSRGPLPQPRGSPIALTGDAEVKIEVRAEIAVVLGVRHTMHPSCILEVNASGI